MSERPNTPWLVAAFVIAAVFFLVPPAMAASAAVLTLSATPANVTPGGEVILSGNLSDASTGALIPMQKVTLQSSPDGVSWTNVLSTISRTGQFQVTRLLRDPGTYYFRVEFSGTRTYAAATSPPVKVTVTSPSGPQGSVLSIFAAPQIVTQGGTVTISGTLVASPGGRVLPDRSVVVFSSPDGVSFSPVSVAVTSQNGMYSTTTVLNIPGRVFFRAVYSGDSTYTGSTSPTVAVDVTALPQKATNLTLGASNSTIALGQNLNLAGILKETYAGKRIGGAAVTLQFSLDGGAWSLLDQKITDGNGEFLVVHTPTKGGKYQFRAAYAGNATYAPAESVAVTVNVTSPLGPQASNLSIQASPKSLPQGGTVTISGNLSTAVGGRAIPGRSIVLFSSSDNVTFSPFGVATTAPDGTYLGSTTLNTPGRFFFKAVYNGDSTYTGRESAVVAVDVYSSQQKFTTLSIRASASSLVLGQAVDLSGALSEAGTGTRISAAPVAVQWSLDGGAWNPLGQSTTGVNGEYSVVHTPARAGTYQYRATYSGNATYAGASSAYVSVNVRSPAGPQDSRLLINATPRDLAQGGTVTLFGNLTSVQEKKGISGRSVLLFTSSDNITFSPLGVVATAIDGAYSSSTTLNTPGRFFFKAAFRGDLSYSGSESAVVAVNVTVPQQKATTLSLLAAPTSLVLGQSVNVTGVLKETQGSSRVPNAPVTVQFSVDRGAWSTLGQSTTDANGEYAITHTPSKAGTYQYRAAYAGSATHGPSASGTVTVTVASMPPSKATTLTIQSTPASPARGETYSINGLLREAATGTGITGKVVRVERSGDGTTWSLVSMVTTRTGGTYSVSEVQQAGGRFYYRAIFSGDRFSQGSNSPVIQVLIRRVSDVSLSASPVVIPAGGTVNCTGILVDAQSGAGLPGETVKVMISEENTPWSTFGSTVTRNDGAWNLSGTLPKAGSYFLAARFEGSASHEADWSNSVGIKVK
ncbi:MAG: Bacterial Ig-like domain (group 1) [Methanoregulaceae archaeon PtaB.Bin152]|nr:MAG: Bacterial Ig-like domain (group 1) [Methanoregulaceae archaeon PtaB.Bin152]